MLIIRICGCALQILKRVGIRYVKKRLHVRIEHVKKSSCRDEFLKRVATNEEIKKEARKKKGIVASAVLRAGRVLLFISYV